MRQSQQSHQGVHRRREDESRGHEAFDVAVVGNESVYEFPDGIGEQECRSDHSQLRSIQRSAVENGFLHDIETRAADIVETVPERRRRECLQTQAAVVFRARVGIHLAGRGRGTDAVEFREAVHGVSRGVRASGDRRSAVRDGRSGSWWHPYRRVFRRRRRDRLRRRHRRRDLRRATATGS